MQTMRLALGFVLIASSNGFAGYTRFARGSFPKLSAVVGEPNSEASSYDADEAIVTIVTDEAAQAKAAEEIATRLAIEQKAAEEEAARKAAEEAARIAAEKKAAEEEAARKAAEEAARIAAEKKAAEEEAARKAAEEAARIAAEIAAREAAILAAKKEIEAKQRALLGARLSRDKAIFDKRAAYAARLRARQAAVEEARSGTPESIAKYKALVDAQLSIEDKCYTVLCALGMHDTHEDVPDPESDDYEIVHGHLDEKPWNQISHESDFFWEVPAEKYVLY